MKYILKHLFLIALITVQIFVVNAQDTSEPNSLDDKIKGLLIGSFIGDAVGGPVEFQSHEDIQTLREPPKLWKEGELMNKEEIDKTAGRLSLRSYADLRPDPEPYGQWAHKASPGTVTDDSRHKLILIDMLRKAYTSDIWPVSKTDMAQAYLDWPDADLLEKHPEYEKLTEEWLGETWKAVNWILGDRNLEKSYPVERLWNALPTCYGQMVLPPVAALFPGDPEEAYKAAYNLAFFDNGWGKDMNAALVAGLSIALELDRDLLSNEEIWKDIYRAMRETDPYGYSEIPWTGRSVNRYLDMAIQFARESDNSPARLFEMLDEEFANTIKWEAQVPFVVIFSSIEICQYDPLAALELTIEWGHDHDSYAQLLGAFVGAIYGQQVFQGKMKQTMQKQLYVDYHADVDELSGLLWDLSQLSKSKKLISLD